MSDQQIDDKVLGELREVMGDQYVALLDTFLDDCEKRMAQLKSANDAKDAEGLCYAAHSFKGSCSNMGAATLAELCRQLEERIKVRPLLGVEDLIGQITREYHHMRLAYERERQRVALENAGHHV